MRPCNNIEDVKEVWKELPHLASDVIELLEKYLIKDMNVFEWGSGGSTIWIAKRVLKIHSVEASSHWYDFLIEKIKE